MSTAVDESNPISRIHNPLHDLRSSCPHYTIHDLLISSHSVSLPQPIQPSASWDPQWGQIRWIRCAGIYGRGVKTKFSSCLDRHGCCLPQKWNRGGRGGSRVPGFWWKSIKKKQQQRRQWFPATLAQPSTACNTCFVQETPSLDPSILLVASIWNHSSSSLYSYGMLHLHWYQLIEFDCRHICLFWFGSLCLCQFPRVRWVLSFCSVAPVSRLPIGYLSQIPF